MSSRTFAFLLLAVSSAGVAVAAPAQADDAACIAASEAALPLRASGKLHDALKQLVVCAAPACPAEVKAECAQRIEAIKGAMPTLILGAKDGAGNDFSTAAVTLDGVPLPGALDGRALEIDPGEHTFRFDLPGQAPLEKKLVLRQGEKDRRESVVLGPPPTVAPPAPPAPPPPSSWSTRRTLAIVTGGVGVVGVGLGAMFGVYAGSSQSRQKSDCSPAACRSYPQGLEDYNTAQKDATGSTVAFAVGTALVAAGVVLWVTAPSAQRAPAASAHGLRLTPGLVGTGRGLVLGADL